MLYAASTSMTTGARRWDKRWAERTALLQNFFRGRGASAAASKGELLNVIARLQQLSCVIVRVITRTPTGTVTTSTSH